jgi:hypothetical protein
MKKHPHMYLVVPSIIVITLTSIYFVNMKNKLKLEDKKAENSIYCQ